MVNLLNLSQMVVLSLLANPSPTTTATHTKDATHTQTNPQAEYHLVDMMVAQVDATVIALSTLLAETRLVLLQMGGIERAGVPHLSQALLNQVLKAIVQRTLLLGEIRRLGIPSVPDREVEVAIEKIRHWFKAEHEFMRFLEMSGLRKPGEAMMPGFEAPAGLVAIVAAELQVDRFLAPSVRSASTVRESDIVLCYQAHPELFKERSLASVREEIRAVLVDQDREWVYRTRIAELTRRATIRYAEGFEAPESNQRLERARSFDCPDRHVTTGP